jgi:hypothetical protein
MVWISDSCRDKNLIVGKSKNGTDTGMLFPRWVYWHSWWLKTLDQEWRVKQAQVYWKDSKAPWWVELSERAKSNNAWNVGDNRGHSLAHVQVFYICDCWRLVNFSLNLTTLSIPFLIELDIPAGSHEFILTLGLATHIVYLHCIPFGKGLFISLGRLLFLMTL